MRATTQVAMAILHVGVKGAKPESWSGTFAECVIQLGKYLGPLSMATRFDIVLARSEEEARNALTFGRKRQTIFPDEFDLDALARLMEADDSASSEATDSEVQA